MQPRRDHRRQRQVGIDVGAGQPVLHAQPLAMPDDAHRAGAVVVAPCDGRRGERPWHEALVGVDVGREQQRQLAQARQLPGEEAPEELLVAGERVLAVARPSEQWMWHELPSRSSHFAMKVIDMPSWAAISLAPVL